MVKASINKSGRFYLSYSFDGLSVDNIDRTQASDIITVVPLRCTGDFPSYNLKGMEKAVVNEEASLEWSCSDKFGNNITTGGNKFTVVISRGNPGMASISDLTPTVHDTKDGLYSIKFVPEVEAQYTFTITNDAGVYGQRAKHFLIMNKVCNGATSVRCPNDANRCVASVLSCLAANDCKKSTPFFCDINGETNCLESQKDCDCPTGFTHCSAQKLCVPTKDHQVVCPKKVTVDCSNVKESPHLCPDNICRRNSIQCPSQRVCPVGLSICPDLTCALTLSLCNKHQECGSNQVRCQDQSCALTHDLCPTSITCSDSRQVVCPDNTCADTELDCKAPLVCNGLNQFVCQDGKCAVSQAQCKSNPACGQGKTLCSDLECREICNKSDIAFEQTAEEMQRAMQPDYEAEQLRIQLEKEAEEARIRKEIEDKRLAEIERLRLIEEAKAKKIEAERIAKEIERLRVEAEKAAKIKLEEEKRLALAEIERQRLAEIARIKAAQEAAERARIKAIQDAETARLLAIQVATDARIASFTNVYASIGRPLYNTAGTPVRSIIKLTHYNTGCNLHSHNINKFLREQEVTCYYNNDSNDYWYITGTLANGGTVLLRHQNTNKYLWIDNFWGSERTGHNQKEVTARNWAGQNEQYLRVNKIYDCDRTNQGILAVGDMITITNGNGNYFLHSHRIDYSAGSRQQEVTGFNGRDSNDYWIISGTW